MRIAVISDTHLPRGSRRLPDRCVEELRGADLILHGGDIATTGVLDELDRIGPPVRAVLGNVDEPARARGAVPVTALVDAEGAGMALVPDAGPAKGRI